MPYLVETVTSLLGQTCSSFELLVIDDGSTDESLSYLQSIRDPRLRLISQRQRGLTATLNRMLAEASTPWLMRHDADDIAFADRVAISCDYIRRSPDAGMFYSYARYCQQGRVAGNFRTTTASPSELRAITQRGYLLAICHPTVTLNVEKARNVGGYRFDLHIEDIDLWWRMALAYDIQLIPEYTVAVRHNLRSVSANNFELQCVNTLFVQYLLLSHLWDLTPLPYDEVQDRLRNLVNQRQVRFREHARLTNIWLGKKQSLRAFRHAGLAFMASPEHLLKRVAYEFLPKGAVTNGENPLRFAEMKSAFWPAQELMNTRACVPHPDLAARN
jgi:glycosyltransferase involved in cell wall biosynthesis